MSAITRNGDEMKVVSYSYILDGHQQHLYVDGELDSSQFPLRIKAIISGRSGTVCKESVINGFGVKSVEQFREQGYLAPCRFVTEAEGEL